MAATLIEVSAGKRIEICVRDAFSGMSRREAIMLCERGGVKTERGARIKKGTQLDQPMTLAVDLAVLDERTTEERQALAEKEGELIVLARGPRWTVIRKPAPLGSLARHYGDTLHFAHFAQKLLPVDVSALPDLGLVHRLDNGTSGTMLFAHDHAAYETFVSARGNTLQRTYWAMARNVRHDSGSVDTAIENQEAVTTYRVLGRSGDVALFEARIRGGRRHQIRIHMASLGAPLLGDGRYGERPAQRLALHAHRLDFVCPDTREEVMVTAAVDEGFWSFAPALRVPSKDGRTAGKV